MNTQELRSKSIEELNTELSELHRERFNLSMQKGMGELFINELFPNATMVTPNFSEAANLTGRKNLEAAANVLLESGCKSVLVTDTEPSDPLIKNILFQSNGNKRLYLLDKCGLPDIPETQHCFNDSTHHTCCEISRKARNYADSSGNPIGKLADDVFKQLPDNHPKKKYFKQSDKRPAVIASLVIAEILTELQKKKQDVRKKSRRRGY